jgi:hypothetical protein
VIDPAIVVAAEEVIRTASSATEVWTVGGLCALVVGALIWYVKHVTTTTIPDLMTKTENAVSKTQDTHKAVMEKAFDSFAVEQKEARTLFREEIGAERAGCERRHGELLANSDKKHQENMALLHQILDLARDKKGDKA